MRGSVFLRRVLALLLVALSLGALLTAFLYTMFSRSIFTRLKADELIKQARQISTMNITWPNERDSYLLFMTVSSTRLFGAWLYVSDFGLRQRVFEPIAEGAPSPTDLARIRELIAGSNEQLINGGADSITFTARLPEAGEALFVGVPMRNVAWTRSVIGTVFFIRPMSEFDAGIRSLTSSLLVSALAAFLLMLGPAYVAVHRLLKPLRQIQNVAQAMNAGNFALRADVSQNGELADLATSMNALAERLEHSVSALELERNRLREVFHGMREGLIAVDPGGQVTDVNRSVSTLLGQSDEALIERLAGLPDMLNARLNDTDASAGLPDMFKPAGLPDMSRSADEESAAAEAPWVAERDPLLAILADCLNDSAILRTTLTVGERTLSANATPLRSDNGALAGAVLLLGDITEAEHLEQTRRDYVANVSHELRSPLTAMRALIEPLRDGLVPDEDDRHRYYGILLRENIRLGRLIDDMLELSRLQAGAHALQPEKFNLSDLFESVWARYQPSADEAGLTLDIRQQDASLPSVYADPDRVEQILVILLDNAIKFTPRGGSITLRTEVRGDKLAVQVADTGSGIDPADLGHVFDRFFKADKAHQQPGTGLGLSIAREIIQAMGESINVSCPPGRGTVFTFTLPLASTIR